jgi:hypothetical protein
MKISRRYKKLIFFFCFQNFIFISLISLSHAQSECGYFPATFSFENDNDGSIPNGWVDNSQPNGNVQVIESAGGHKNVVEFTSTSASSSRSQIDHDFSDQASGTLELWMMKSSVNQGGPAVLYLYGVGGPTLMNFIIDDGTERVAYVDPTGAWTSIMGYNYNDDQWFHMRMEWDCTSDTWNLWIDGVQYLINEAFESSRTDTAVDWMRFSSFEGGNPSLYYADAIGFSWDPNYDVGDNLDGEICLTNGGDYFVFIMIIVVSIIAGVLVTGGIIYYKKAQIKPRSHLTRRPLTRPKPTYRPAAPIYRPTVMIRDQPKIEGETIPAKVFCPFCGKPLNQNNKFCDNCGTDLKDE